MMDDQAPQPTIFANKVILQVAQQMLPGNATLSHKDFMSIRVVFRRCQGSWLDFSRGDTRQISLLKAVVTAWCKANANENEQLI